MHASVIHDVILVLESCEAKLEYMGNQRVGTRDAPDCLHRAAKARDMIATLKRHLPPRDITGEQR